MGIWTQREIVDLDLTWEEFQGKYPERSYDSYHHKRKRTSEQTPAVRFEDRHNIPDPTRDEAYFRQLIEVAEAKRAQDPRQVEVSVVIDTDLPIGIAFTGDWHVGQAGTNHRRLVADNALIAATEGLYVVGTGDYVHNAKAGTRPGNALYQAAFPDPMDQFAFARRELERFRGKILALTRGCHLDWDQQLVGIDSLDEICKKLETVNLWHGGIVHLRVGSQSYRIGVRHKYKGESGINTTNAQRRFTDEYPETQNLDVICLGHLHFNDMQKVSRRGLKTVRLRAGSYFELDDYAQKLAGYRGEIGVPIVVLFPDEHRVLPFEGSDLVLATRILSLLRDTD